MKINQLILSALVVLALFSCGKEDPAGMIPLELTDTYSIKPGSANPVEQKRYEIFSKYNVPVYFNDTISRIFLRLNSRGDSVFEYEKLDLQWRFTGYTNNSFKFIYLKNDEKKLSALAFVEKFLEVCSKPLRPFSILLTDTLITDAKTIIASYKYANSDSTIVLNERVNTYPAWRTMVFAGVNNLSQSDSISELAGKDVVKNMIKLRITNYPNLLAPFYAVTDKKYYDAMWEKLDPTAKIPEIPVEAFSTWILTDAGANYYLNIADHRFTPEQIESIRANIRSVTGKFGFVCGNPNIPYFSPSTPDSDLAGFVDEMLRYNREKFVEYWGKYPQVMKKYEIIYAIIDSEFGYKL